MSTLWKRKDRELAEGKERSRETKDKGKGESQELTHWKRPWCWERLRERGGGDDTGWDGWMASPTPWTWVWGRSGSWWWTGKPGMLRSMGSQRVRHDWATEHPLKDKGWGRKRCPNSSPDTLGETSADLAKAVMLKTRVSGGYSSPRDQGSCAWSSQRCLGPLSKGEAKDPHRHPAWGTIKPDSALGSIYSPGVLTVRLACHARHQWEPVGTITSSLLSPEVGGWVASLTSVRLASDGCLVQGACLGPAFAPGT